MQSTVTNRPPPPPLDTEQISMSKAKPRAPPKTSTQSEIPTAVVYRCNGCRDVIDLEAAHFFGFPTFQCDECCSTKVGNAAKRVYCSDKCKRDDLRDFHHMRCGRQNLLRKPPKKQDGGAALTIKCQNGHGKMLKDMSSSVPWCPGFTFSNINPDSDPPCQHVEAERQPIDMQSAVIAAGDLRQIFLEQGRCLCRGALRPIRPCHKFSIIWPQLPPEHAEHNFDGCCPELVGNMLSVYAEDVVLQYTTKPILCTVHEVAVTCLEGSILLLALAKDYWGLCDKMIRLAFEYRANGFLEKERSCYSKLVACAWDQPSRLCRIFICLNVLIGEVQDILDPIDEWRLDLRCEEQYANYKERRVPDDDLDNVEDLVTTAMGYIMILQAGNITKWIIGEEEKLFDLQAIVLHFRVRVLFQRLRNHVARDEPRSDIGCINTELQEAVNELMAFAFVKQTPGLRYFYSCCVMNISCFCRERMDMCQNGIKAILQRLVRCWERHHGAVDTLDRRRRADLRIESLKAIAELAYRRDKYDEGDSSDGECDECGCGDEDCDCGDDEDDFSCDGECDECGCVYRECECE